MEGGGPLLRNLLANYKRNTRRQFFVYLLLREIAAMAVIPSYSVFLVQAVQTLFITEAAVGAGVTSVLLFLTLKKVNVLKGKKDE